MKNEDAVNFVKQKIYEQHEQSKENGNKINTETSTQTSTETSTETSTDIKNENKKEVSDKKMEIEETKPFKN